MCYPKLKKVLQNEDNSTRKFHKDLAKLHKLLEFDKESIRFYFKKMKVECDSTTVRELAQNYKKICDFECYRYFVFNAKHVRSEYLR